MDHWQSLGLQRYIPCRHDTALCHRCVVESGNLVRCGNFLVLGPASRELSHQFTQHCWVSHGRAFTNENLLSIEDSVVRIFDEIPEIVGGLSWKEAIHVGKSVPYYR